MFPDTWSVERIAVHAFAELITNQQIIIDQLKEQEKQMATQASALATLQAAVDQLQADVNAFVKANSGGATDAQLAALTTQVQAIDAVVNPPAPAPAA